MASGPHSNSGGGGGGKVYSRKSITRLLNKPAPTTTATQTDTGAHPSSDASNLNHYNRHNGHTLGHRVVTISLGGGGPTSRRDLRRRLACELDQVRALTKRIENAATTPTGYAMSQFSATDPITPLSTKQRGPPPHLTLAVDQSTDLSEKDKRTPKANQMYRDTEFLLGKKEKDKLLPLPPHPHPQPPDNTKKSKSKKLSLEAERRLYAPVFKECAALLQKFMKHKHAWVFNKPVDAQALGLHDYHTVITRPMDLGTVKARLGAGDYPTPREFAADVRLTFRNAMTYNPPGQDVYVMAETLLRIFDEKWSSIEAELEYISPPMPTPASSLPAASKKPAPIDTRSLERSDSTAPAAVETTPRPHIGRPPALKKPKAKEPNKREMTFFEKQKLSNNLQSLPPEKLDNVVQIIKRRNLSLSQHDDEIEVDIDSFDVETLWELDRFVTNYKKSLSKNKRKAELVVQVSPEEAEQNNPPPPELVVEERIHEAVAAELPKESAAAADENEKYVGSSSPVQGDQRGENASRSSSSGSSSSDSGSSSSDTDTDSSSADGSDAAQSPRI